VTLALIGLSVRASAQQKTLVCFGDSITAGYGLDASRSYPADLEQLLNKRGYAYRVVNQGVSGNTTKDAVARVNSIVSQHPEAAVVEFGGNDGLRGLPLDQTRRNLDQLLPALETAHIRILLAGITLPPNYGQDYIQQFEQIFRDLARKHHAAFVPMIYKGLVNVPGTIQPDGIHPTARGSETIAHTLLPVLTPLLRK
jgi:acyl-CoA thioesterase-1